MDMCVWGVSCRYKCVPYRYMLVCASERIVRCSGACKADSTSVCGAVYECVRCTLLAFLAFPGAFSSHAFCSCVCESVRQQACVVLATPRAPPFVDNGQ